MPNSRAMRRIDQPRATNLEIASCSCTLSMLAIVAAHTPVFPDYFAALRPPPRWYTLKPFISTRPGTLSLTADTTRQIAEALRLSIKTVESHRAHIKEKLKLANSAELVQHA